ncbi:hypothetical protein [Chroococcidiopsis sp. CCMEE 29]|nr:hypothetical protein [Chroococcidiopsis sp. CCMEE 29]
MAISVKLLFLARRSLCRARKGAIAILGNELVYYPQQCKQT